MMQRGGLTWQLAEEQKRTTKGFQGHRGVWDSVLGWGVVVH